MRASRRHRRRPRARCRDAAARGRVLGDAADPDHDLRAARAFRRPLARQCRPVLALPCGVLRGRRLHHRQSCMCAMARPTALAAPAGILAGTLLSFVFAVRGAHARGLFHPDHAGLRLHRLGRRLSLGIVHRRRQWRDQCAVPGDRPLIASPTPRSITMSCSSPWCCAGLPTALLVTSPFGLTLRGIKSSESRMRSLGYDVGRHLYVAFVLSGMLASIAGVLYVYYNRFINPVAAVVPGLGRSRADGDRRRQRNHPRAVPRLRHHPDPAQLGQRLLPLLYGGARHRVHRHGAVGAAGHHGTGGALARGRIAERAHDQPRSRSTGSRKCSAACAPSTTPRSSWRAASGAC